MKGINKKYFIYVEGNKDQRWIVKEIIYKYVTKNVKIEPVEIKVPDYMTSKELTYYIDAFFYDFQTTKRVYRKIVNELKKIGLRVSENKEASVVVF